MNGRRLLHIRAMIVVIAGIGCSHSPAGPHYEPDIPTSWSASVTNPLYPLAPGTIWSYSGQTDEGLETVVVEVLSDKRMVNGVSATIVRDRVYLDGSLIEDTFDWYAQDAAGNVWYLGEDSKEIENGQVVSSDGSWEWGVDDALPGIIMWGDPADHLGESYRQEFYEDEAEDWGKVLGVNESVSVPYGQLSNCLKTEDWNALESGGREHKYYCPGVGLVLEVAVSGGERLELTSRTTPP